MAAASESSTDQTTALLTALIQLSSDSTSASTQQQQQAPAAASAAAEMVAAITAGSFVSAAQLADAGALDDTATIAPLVAAMARLLLFVQLNWTGPPLDATALQPVEGDDATISAATAADLELDGETAYKKLLSIGLLLDATRRLRRLVGLDSSESEQDTTQIRACTRWWLARALFVHQRVLSGPSDQLRRAILAHYEAVIAWLEHSNATSSSSSTCDLLAQALVEKAVVHHHYTEDRAARECFMRAQQVTGMVAELTGALGRRTKFQTFDTAQLFLSASSATSTTATTSTSVAAADAATASSTTGEHTDGSDKRPAASVAPRDVPVEEELLLPSLKFVEEQAQDRPLTPIDQTIILGRCLDLARHNPHGEVMTEEEISAMLQRIGKECNNWLIHSTFLLMRSRIEKSKRRTVERAALQVQSLVDQYKDTEPAAIERIRWLFTVVYPAQHQLKKELGDRFLELGVAASALQVFEELEMYEEMIQCHVIMNRKERGIELAQERIAIEPTPSLYCALGELTNDTDHYLTAWELSGRRYARAKRMLARTLLRQGKYEESIPHFEDALAINPLYAATWFSFGCALIQVKNFSQASIAFSRMLHLEPEDGEAWCNLAAVYTKLKKPAEAYNALQEAVKFNRESWKIWENFFYAAIEHGKLFSAISAMHRLLELRGKEFNASTLQVLTDYIIEEHLKDEDGKLMSRLAELLGRASSILPGSATVWQSYAEYHNARGDKDKMLDCLLKMNRQLKVSGWNHDEEKFVHVARASVALCEAYLATNLSKHLASAKMHLRPIIKQAEDNFANHAEFHRLQELLQRVEQQHEALKSGS